MEKSTAILFSESLPDKFKNKVLVENQKRKSQ